VGIRSHYLAQLCPLLCPLYVPFICPTRVSTQMCSIMLNRKCQTDCATQTRCTRSCPLQMRTTDLDQQCHYLLSHERRLRQRNRHRGRTCECGSDPLPAHHECGTFMYRKPRNAYLHATSAQPCGLSCLSSLAPQTGAAASSYSCGCSCPRIARTTQVHVRITRPPRNARLCFVYLYYTVLGILCVASSALTYSA